MTELSGTLAGVGMPAIVRFLTALKKTGCLSIIQDDWRGQIFFDSGRVVGASFGSRRGLSALDALVQALPDATFEFESDVRATPESTISVSHDVLQAHLLEVAANAANGQFRLPALDAIPRVVEQDAAELTDEPLELDRGTLQTLLAVDGQRTVREIMTQRGSFDALWQLGNLAEVGLIKIKIQSGTATASIEAPRDEVADVDGTSREEAPVDGRAAEAALVSAKAVEVPPVESSLPTAFDIYSSQSDVAVIRCPKLGFEDDSTNSFGRPTRLHRCFAAGAALPLSLDQQRELCLSEQYGTCPRLTMAAGSNTKNNHNNEGTDDPRIVRLPLGARHKAAERSAVEHRERDRQAVGGSAEPARFRSAGGSARDGGTPSASSASSGSPPTPLRSRMERTHSADSATAVAEAPVPPRESRRTEAGSGSDSGSGSGAKLQRQTLVGEPVERKFGGISIAAIAGGGVVLAIVAVIGYLMLPHLGDLFTDDSLDPAALPNTSAIAAGTPVSQVTGARATPAARATANAAGPAGSANAAGPAGAANAAGAASASGAANAPGVSSASANPASAPTAAAQPTRAPEPTQAATAPGATSGPLAAQAANIVLDEHFAGSNDRKWPNNPQGTAWLTNGSFRVATRQVGQFVAIGAPISDVLQDVVVNASFRKVSGPAGGGYGIIVRDQSAATHDGASQDGRYYVLEVGDKGEVGIWRRDGDHWADLLPWQRSDAVKPGMATNELTVRASGTRLSLSVNGTQVASRTDAAYSSGGVGIFVGGDSNQVAVDRFIVQTP